MSILLCQLLSNLPNASLPLPESCDLYCPHTLDHDSRLLITVFETAPRLRNVTLSIWHPTLLRLPPLVDTLHLACDVCPVMCLGVLRQCPNLGPSLRGPFPGERYPDNALLLRQLHTFLIQIDGSR
jgi:hypothetical protein